MALPDLMRADAVGIVSTNDFGELTTYTGSTGALAVTAIVRRETIEGSPQDRARAPQRRAHYYVKSADIPTPRRGLDSVSFPEEVGGTPTAWRVVEIWNRDDPAVWHLLVVK